MNTNWLTCKNILCIRPDNMGDLLMSTPAIRALKESFDCTITLLTSSMGKAVAKYVPEIDDVMVCDFPWIKSSTNNEFEFDKVAEQIRQRQFDAAVIFTVYSQNPMPSIMLAYVAGIPKRLAYCRENPYKLLTDWRPEKEPYSFIQHQVRRDLSLVGGVGAFTKNEKIFLQINDHSLASLIHKLSQADVDIAKPWMILHAGVSEEKKKYPKEYWVEAAKRIRQKYNYQLLFTGSSSEAELVENIVEEIGANAFSLAGKLSLEEFIILIQQAPLVISVNTGTIHLAAAVNTPVIVLYALTNPQHAPWKVRGRVLIYDIAEEMRSKNEVIRFVHEKMQPQNVPMVTPDNILQAVREVLIEGDKSLIAEMIPLHYFARQLL